MAAGGARLAALIVATGFPVPVVAARIREFPGRVAGTEAEYRHDPSDAPRSRRGRGAGGRRTVQAVLDSHLLHADETSLALNTAGRCGCGCSGR